MLLIGVTPGQALHRVSLIAIFLCSLIWGWTLAVKQGIIGGGLKDRQACLA